MAELIVREWLNDCKALSPSEARSFSSSTVQNNDLIQGIFSIFEEKSKNHDILEAICNQLFIFYRSRDVELQRFSLQYLPAMITSCLCSIAQGDKKNVKCIEVLLLGIYNLEVVDATGKPKIHSFRMPSIAQPSIYHVPISLASAASATLTENSLSRLDKGDSQVIAIGPFSQVENLNAQNRMQVMTVLMNLYNRNLSFLRKSSLHALCKMCTRLTKQGFGKQGNHHRASYGSEGHFGNPYSKPSSSRIPLNSSFLLEILHGILIHLRFNGLGSIGLQALDDVHHRASQELMADVLLVTNGVRNSFHTRSSGQVMDGPMGISISISPSTSLTTVSKSIITNASFRTKKLPDDIPIQSSKDGEPSDAQKSLATISEEADDGEGKQQHNTKGKEKGKAPLERMISKMGGGSKGKDKSNVGAAQSNAESGGGTINAADGRKKDHVESGANKSSGRRGSNPTIKNVAAAQNGDSSTVAKTVQRDSPAVDGIEMKTLAAVVKPNEAKDRGKFANGGSAVNSGANEEEGDGSANNALPAANEKEDGRPFHSSNEKIGENMVISASRTEIHTLV